MCIARCCCCFFEMSDAHSHISIVQIKALFASYEAKSFTRTSTF